MGSSIDMESIITNINNDMQKCLSSNLYIISNYINETKKTQDVINSILYELPEHKNIKLKYNYLLVKHAIMLNHIKI